MQKHSYSFDALGTQWVLETPNGSSMSDTFIERVRQTVEQFTRDYSRFDTQSLIGKLNTTGSICDPSHELLAMFSFAQEMYSVSEGAFNISIGGALHTLGYGSQDQAAQVWQNPWTAISITTDHITIPSDMTIDFGGFGKGWLIDKIADLFTADGIREFIINGGGDLYIHTNEPTEIGLEHPYDATRLIGSTHIAQGGLGVSSNIKRTWNKDGVKHAHILTPDISTVKNTSVISTYVRADSALIADTMATILLLRPDLETTLAKSYNLKAILLTEDALASMI